MTKPEQTEKKDAFLHRFMADADACREYPNEQERFEHGAMLWDHRGALEAANALGYNSERDGAELFHGRHLQPGVVNYPEMKHPVTGAQGIAVLVEKDVIDRMRKSGEGVPVVNWAHDFSGGAERWITDGKACGVMVGSRWDGEDAYEHCSFMLWDKEAKANARNGFRLSNSWKEDEIDWAPGVHNGVRYDGRLKAAHYTHLAIVPNPRYEGAVIFANAQGGLNAMLNLLGFGKKEAVTLDKEATIEVNGKKYPVLEVVNSLTAMEAGKAKVETTAKDGVLGEKDEIEVSGKKYKLGEVVNALAAAEKAKTPEPKKEPVVEAKAVHETPEFANAVGKIVADALDKARGEGFFNGVRDLALKRPGMHDDVKPANRATERERVESGRKRFGKKEPVKA